MPRERPEEIARDIERQRQALGKTLATLQTRVAPDRVAAAAVSRVARAGQSVTAATLSRARKRPVAVGLIAAGAAWLALGRASQAEHENDGGDAAPR